MADRRVMATALGCVVLVSTIAFPPAPRLVWNVSPSAPTGLYRVEPGGEAARGEMVIARVPAHWRGLAAARHYIPINVPLVKKAAATRGDLICAKSERIMVNGGLAATRLARDRRGRPMPRWSGCVRLREGELFLLMDRPESFDGRYFGPTGRHDVIGTARLIWAG